MSPFKEEEEDPFMSSVCFLVAKESNGRVINTFPAAARDERMREGPNEIVGEMNFLYIF